MEARSLVTGNENISWSEWLIEILPPADDDGSYVFDPDDILALNSEGMAGRWPGVHKNHPFK